MTTDDRAKFEALTNALEEARNGLLWYQDRYPEAVDGSDDEAMARINAALASAQAASAEPAAPTEGAQAKRTPLEALKTYEPEVVIEEARGRLTATGAAMKQQAAGRWVRLEDVCTALASAQAASAEPAARMPPLLNANDLSTNFCAKWSGAQKVEAGDILDWIMQQPLYTTPAPAVAPAAVTDEMQSEFEPDEAGVQALRVAIEGECDGLDITDAQARAVLRYVGATIKCALTKTIRSRTRTPEPQAEPSQTFVQTVPDKCDRIIWRGHYYSLPVAASPTPDEQRAQAAQEDVAPTCPANIIEAISAYGDARADGDVQASMEALPRVITLIRTALAGRQQL